MDFLTEPQVRAGVARALGSLLQAAATALHRGVVSMSASYLILVIGIAGAVTLSLMAEVGALLVGQGATRRAVRWLERRLVVMILVAVLVAWLARMLGH